jgi:hypothetical protein
MCVQRHSMNLNAPAPVPRRNSLRLPPHPPHIPVPPSLKQSPYLNAPIFNCDIPSPRLPSEEDERWLQDTVPVASEGRDSANVNFDRRRGSIVLPSRRSCQSGVAYPTSSSMPVSPATDSAPPSPSSASSRALSQTTRYLAHSLAPPPQSPLLDWHSKFLDGRPVHLYQAHSEPNILRRGQPS